MSPCGGPFITCSGWGGTLLRASRAECLFALLQRANCFLDWLEQSPERKTAGVTGFGKSHCSQRFPNSAMRKMAVSLDVHFCSAHTFRCRWLCPNYTRRCRNHAQIGSVLVPLVLHRHLSQHAPPMLQLIQLRWGLHSGVPGDRRGTGRSPVFAPRCLRGIPRCTPPPVSAPRAGCFRVSMSFRPRSPRQWRGLHTGGISVLSAGASTGRSRLSI